MPQLHQTYKNHFRLFVPYHFFIVPVLLLNFFNTLRHVYLTPSLATTWDAIVAAALLTLAVVARVMALTVQDRVIRVEMRQRLKDLLPVDLQARIMQLTPKQLVALRFAGDEEMPALVQEVLGGSLSTPKAIKLRVRNWQGDFLRC
jgi:hypothetical protein